MSALLKGATSVLIAMALMAIIGTGVILYYNTKDKGDETAAVTEQDTQDSLLPNGEEPQTAGAIAPTDQDSQEEPDTQEETGAAVTPVSTSTAAGENGSHKHSYTPTVAKEATCTVMGKMLYTCSCGSYYIEPIPTIPHTPGEWTVTKKVTTKADGKREKRCIVCGSLLNEETVKKETLSSNTVSKNAVSENHYKHTHTYKSEVTKEETCTEEGIATFTCDCGATYTEPIPATNHPSRRTIVTEPTCLDEGSSITSCNICNAVISHDILNKVSHKWGSWKVTTPATKDAEGVRTRTCKVGGEEQTQAIPKLGAPGSDHTHDYSSYSVTTEPGCTTTGTGTYTCSCGDTKTETIAALGHNPGGWKTVTEATETTKGVRKKYCRRCNEELASEEFEYEPTHTHNYTSTVAVEPTCKQAGTRVFTCSVCGDSYQSQIPATGNHTKSTTQQNGHYYCTVCGDILN